MTTMERQQTFRKNAKLWLDSAPEGRLLILKQVHHIQQSSQIKLLSQCGVTWEVNQLKKEASGKGSAAFRCLLLHDGEYTTKFMSKYNQLTRSPDLWDVMAPHEKTRIGRTHLPFCIGFKLCYIHARGGTSRTVSFHPSWIGSSECCPSESHELQDGRRLQVSTLHYGPVLVWADDEGQ